ncbi:3'(2'),5'-bisphosphate nucleotidase [uncultured Candidatus Thioglobus sp.]|nr:3'(2'),5'-bisphosphate nucleotidase [uncultured Candidatus Thioglobus sp.]
MEFKTILPQLIELTTKTGEEILSHYQTGTSVSFKDNNTPLTIADQSAHNIIVAGLSLMTPDIPILSEESDAISFTQRSQWDEYWLVDPLDGTRDFIEETGEFCICIAYIKNHKTIFGLVAVPLESAHYYGFDGNAYKYQNGIEQRINTCTTSKPLRVVTGHYSSKNSTLLSHLTQLGECQHFHLGSALKFCRIAEGVYDYYPRFGPCSEWDTAAGVCILESAGGSVVDKNGDFLKYNTKDDLLSPAFFAFGTKTPTF